MLVQSTPISYHTEAFVKTEVGCTVPLEYVFGEGMKSPHSLSMLKNLWSEACGFFRHLSLEYGSERQPWGGGSDSAGSNFVTLIRALESNNKNFRYKTYSIAKGI